MSPSGHIKIRLLSHHLADMVIARGVRISKIVYFLGLRLHNRRIKVWVLPINPIT
jgi:hypothetical protein